MKSWGGFRVFGFLGLMMMIAGFSAPSANAQSLSGANLVNALRRGGYVLVIRHANAPAQPPGKAAADAENVKLERQLDSAGRDAARGLGEAVKTLRIPIGDVFSSPTYRALETIRLASLGQAKTVAELDEGAAGMQGNAEAQRVNWLMAKVAEAPRAGTDTIIVTHAPNIQSSFGIDAAAGEAIVFRPDGKGGAAQVARIKIGDWPSLAK
jgi:broad specificity phosphatase PhoE